MIWGNCLLKRKSVHGKYDIYLTEGATKFIKNPLLFLIVTVCFQMIFLLNGSLNGAGLPPAGPPGILHLPLGEYAILVNKSTQRLFLLKATEENGIITEKKFICATGKMSGDKQHSGDRKTPEGIYFCRGLFLPPRLGKRYGVCAIPWTYPNLIDRRNGRDGSGIWLHGINESRPVKSTLGCVVLRNSDLIYLAGRMHLHTSPVVVTRGGKKRPGKGKVEAEKAALSFLERWKNAWASGDIAAYISCYDASFSSKGMDLRQWLVYKKRLFRRYRHAMSIHLDAPVIVIGKDYLVFAFKQHFRGGRFSAVGLKRLYVKRTGKGYKIIGEAWLPDDKLQRARRHYALALSKIAIPSDGFRIVAALPRKTQKPAGQDPYEALKHLLPKWKTSWETRDITRYMSYYSKQFKHAHMGLGGWKTYKLDTFKKNGPIRLTLGQIKIKVNKKVAFVHFTQIYRSEKVRDVGRKEMVFYLEKGTWKISRERWQRRRLTKR